MSNPEDNKFDFFVHIIESPSAVDFYMNRSEGSLVAAALALEQVPCVTRIAINANAFEAALQFGLSDVMRDHPNRFPILHISAHGSKDGIQLSSGEIVSWEQLREFLLPINESLNGVLLFCISACEGYSACQMAMEVEESSAHPYFAMVGNAGKPLWSDTAVAFQTFYHLLAKGKSIPEAVEAMKVASADSGWCIETAEEIKKSYIDFVKSKKVEPQIAQRELEAAVSDEEKPPFVKAAENERNKL